MLCFFFLSFNSAVFQQHTITILFFLNQQNYTYTYNPVDGGKDIEKGEDCNKKTVSNRHILREQKIIYESIIMYVCALMVISSVESQKDVIATQRCSVENQKGAIAVQSQWQ